MVGSTDRVFAGFGQPGKPLITSRSLASSMGAHCRFVHCADLHLGSRFRGVSSRDPAEAERMTESVFRSFSRIVDVALSERADFMVISGDAFDESTITPATRHRFVTELRRLGIPCFIARGNHDPHTSWEDGIPYPGNVHEFGTEPESVTLEGLDGVEVVGVSFADWHEERNLPAMIHGDPGRFTVACLHCDVDSAGGQYAYSPCRLADLLGRGVDYWALGHIHKRQVLSTDPYVVYPGNIQGRKSTESGEKGCYVVTVSEGRVSEARFVPTQGIVWRDESVDITGADLDGVVGCLKGRVRPGDILDLTFTGTGPLDAMLRLHADDVEGAIASGTGCIVSGMDVRTSLEVDMDARAGGMDMTAKVIQAGRRLEGASREEILARILSNPVAKAHGDFFRSMTDDQLRELVSRATGMLAARLEVSP